MGLLKFFKRPLGIALSSGGAKGLAHIPVLEYLDRNNVRIDMIAGSSIGALIGAAYYCGSLYDIKNKMIDFNWRDILRIVDPVLPRSGIISGDKVVSFLSEFIDPGINIEDLPGKLAIVTTDFHSGNPVVYRSGNLLNAVRGSISIPGVFVPIENEEFLLMDGGVANPMPIDILKQMGASITIAVNVHPTAKRRTKTILKERYIDPAKKERPTRTLHHNSRINSESWVDHLTSKFEIKKNQKEKADDKPSIIDVFMQSMEIMEYMNTHLMLKHYKPTVLIEPDVRQIGGLDFDRGVEVFGLGWNAVAKSEFALKTKVLLWK
jgi:NTE family protein